ncbi:MAG: lysine--tRNA ligase [Elusimicrobiota bacterium]|nr:lysine--tRNA ligase [Elusimicrobiota bacterium]
MNKESKDQIDIRKEKLESFKDAGVETYPTSYSLKIDAAEALTKDEGDKVSVAGRIMSRRVMGGSAFCHIKDCTGKIQFYIRKDKVGRERYSFFKQLDIGDFVGVKGELFLTNTGEKTVLASDMEFLGKSLRPLPEKWHKLQDTETRYRKRYLDILVNKESSDLLKIRSRTISKIRNILEARKFIEVETPILQSIPGGAAARPFKTHHNTFDEDLFLRIAPELYLKRLLVGGWDRVFEIGRNFRNEGISTRHNPEFTMMEVYAAYTDYTFMMELSKKIISGVGEMIKKEGYEPSVDLIKGWKKENIWELMSKYTGMDFDPGDSFEELKKKAEKLDVPPGKDSPEKVADRIFSKYVEPKLVSPTIVTGYLTKVSPLAKSSPDDERIAERFEIFIGGQEIGNAYSEQNDPDIQRDMFLNQLNEKADEEEFSDISKIDEDYIEALEYGMPPASGLGIGIDRLIMLLTGAESIREVILFPMLKPLK